MPLVNFTWKYVPPSPQRTCKTFVLEYVSKVFSEKELRSLKRQKARGIDNLPSALLKDCGRYISAPLCSIINLSIETSTVPTIWKSARVMPIFKSRDLNPRYLSFQCYQKYLKRQSTKICQTSNP